ncbi:MAG: PEP-utilizing enzyme, partial [Actinomycetota bacterium]
MAEPWIVDSKPSTRYPIWTRANVGEVFPEPVAPLSGTIGVFENAEPGWRDAFARFGALDHDEYDPDNIESIGVFGGYCYLNVSIARIFGVRTPGLTPEAIDYQFFGEQPGVPLYEPMAGDESPEHTERINQTLGWILTTDGLPELLDDQRLTEDLRANRPDHTRSSNDELLAYMRQVFSHFRRLFANHIYITYAATVPTGIISTVCQEIGEPSLALRLMSGVGDVDSAAPSWRLWEMSRLVAESDA